MKTAGKIIIYQVFPRLFGNPTCVLKKNGTMAENGTGKFAAFTPPVLDGIRQTGITHIWYAGVIEHATRTDYASFGIAADHPAVVKGNAGSGYAIRDYYDVDPDLAESVPHRMAEFEALVRRTQDAGMKVIIDFVPNHVARRYHSDARPASVVDLGEHDDVSKAFDPNNNFYYLPGQALMLHPGYNEFPARATGNNCFSPRPGQNDWYETVKLNYGVDCMNGERCCFDPVPDTWTKMRDILLFWAGKGVDGFRCDMAEMVPVEFWNWVIPQVKAAGEICFIAEVYNPARYRDYIHRGHFDYLYDKVGLYDTLRGVICETLPARDITRCWQAVEGIGQHMVNFLENHDEQRIASDFFAGSAQAGFPGMIIAATLHTNPVMIYSGQEFGEQGMDEEGFSGRDGRTSIFDYWSLECLRNRIYDPQLLTEEQKALHQSYSRLLTVAGREPAIGKGAFFDLMYANLDNPHFNTHRQYAFLRKHEEEVILIAVNFARTEQTVRIIIPPEAFRHLHVPDNHAAIQTDLFSGKQCISTLTAACPFQATLPGYSGKLLKFNFRPVSRQEEKILP
jgi:glycosidase